jgi:HD superfamily phosphohydrolase
LFRISMARQERILRHLDQAYTEPVRDPLWKHIYLSPALLALAGHPLFLKLDRIRQLGPAYLVYPGATHSRHSHSLGVYHLARRMVRALVAYEQCPPLSVEGVKAFLTASLLHDLGHFPFAHALKELPLQEHEQVAAREIQTPPLSDAIRRIAGVDPWIVAAIIDLRMPVGDDAEIPFFRNILSGVLDPDKLDYLTRDAYFCGVSYGTQDIDFVISQIVPDKAMGMALLEKGVTAVENLLFSKYLMYKTVYWHKTVRIATAMIKKALYRGLEDGAIEPRDLYGLDDEEFFRKYTGERRREFVLIQACRERKLYKLVYETPFHADNPSHVALENLAKRASVEEGIARQLTATVGRRVDPIDVILDIPERISFEVDIPVVADGEPRPYLESDTVFTAPVVQRFTETLRRIRVTVAPHVADDVRDHPAFSEWIS